MLCVQCRPLLSSIGRASQPLPPCVRHLPNLLLELLDVHRVDLGEEPSFSPRPRHGGVVTVVERCDRSKRSHRLLERRWLHMLHWCRWLLELRYRLLQEPRHR
uniref:Uncharacterized protein n=1 Tax=Haptolina brevifila TaxID=156173 RepID=A0A7S2CVB2_9EUKA